MDSIRIIQLSPDRWKEYKDLRLEMLIKDPQAFGQRYDKSVTDPDSKWKERLKAAENEDRIVILFAESNRKLIGMIGAYFNSDEETKNSAKIFSVYVTKDFRGKGVAQALQQELLKQLKNIPGFKKIKVQVNKSQSAAFNLYKQGGFEVISTEKMTLGDGKGYEVCTMEQNLE